MKFKCEKNTLVKEISLAHEIISSRNSISILSNVLLEALGGNLRVKASDLKVGFETQIPVDILQEGKTTVNCDKFLNILKSLPEGEIEFVLNENHVLNISPLFKKIDFQLRGMPTDKFPELQEIDQDNYFEFPQADLIEMIASTIFAISNDETRYFMNGVFIEKAENSIHMVASDGKRLSFIRKPLADSNISLKNAIVPPKILNLLKKLLLGQGNLKICVTDKNFFVQYDKYRLYSSLIEGQFPNYQRVIPQTQLYKVVIRKDVLESAVKRVALLVEQKSRRIFLKLTENVMVISSEENEIGRAKEEVECEYTGPETVLVLNSVCLIEPLMEIKEEEISLEFSESDKAVTLKSVPSKDYIHIIMPMQTR